MQCFRLVTVGIVRAGPVGRISIAVMVVTLLVVFDRLQDHGQNKQTKQGGDDDGINHGASSKGCFRSSPAPAQPVCQSRDLHKGCFGVASIPHSGERRWFSNPSVEGGCVRCRSPRPPGDEVKPAMVVVLAAILIGVYANAIRIIHSDDP